MVAAMPSTLEFEKAEPYARLCRLSYLLKEARRNVPEDAPSLGSCLRFPGRVGRRVSQEEIAEALGVTREWYGMLEAGRPIRASVSLLERICNALMLDEQRRAAVFQLGVPELSPRMLECRNCHLLASTRMRSTIKRLWSASNIDEALTIAAEESSRYFADAALVFFVNRVAAGQWDHTFVVDNGTAARHEHFYAELVSSLTPALFDEIVLYPELSEPGDVGTVDSYDRTSVADVYKAGLARHRLQRWVFLHARIRSRGGVIGGIAIKHSSERDYSEFDRAVISIIASVTSLALS